MAIKPGTENNSIIASFANEDINGFVSSDVADDGKLKSILDDNDNNTTAKGGGDIINNGSGGTEDGKDNNNDDAVVVVNNNDRDDNLDDDDNTDNKEKVSVYVPNANKGLDFSDDEDF